MLGKIFKACIYIIAFMLGITILVSIFTTVQAKLYPGQIPGILGYKTVTNFSDKMSPVIKSGDLIIVKETNPRSVSKGDIIAYNTILDAVSISRVSEIQTTKDIPIFSTKGDADKSAGINVVVGEKFLGIARFRIPFAGYLVYFWSTILGIISMGLILIIGLASFITKTRSHKRVTQKRLELKGKVLGN